MKKLTLKELNNNIDFILGDEERNFFYVKAGDLISLIGDQSVLATFKPSHLKALSNVCLRIRNNGAMEARNLVTIGFNDRATDMISELKATLTQFVVCVLSDDKLLNIVLMTYEMNVRNQEIERLKNELIDLRNDFIQTNSEHYVLEPVNISYDDKTVPVFIKRASHISGTKYMSEGIDVGYDVDSIYYSFFKQKADGTTSKHRFNDLMVGDIKITKRQK